MSETFALASNGRDVGAGDVLSIYTSLEKRRRGLEGMRGW